MTKVGVIGVYVWDNSSCSYVIAALMCIDPSMSVVKLQTWSKYCLQSTSISNCECAKEVWMKEFSQVRNSPLLSRFIFQASLPFKNRLYVTPIVCRNNVQLSLAESDFAEYQLAKSSVLSVICHSQGTLLLTKAYFSSKHVADFRNRHFLLQILEIDAGWTLVTVASYEEKIPFIF